MSFALDCKKEMIQATRQRREIYLLGLGMLASCKIDDEKLIFTTTNKEVNDYFVHLLTDYFYFKYKTIDKRMNNILSTYQTEIALSDYNQVKDKTIKDDEKERFAYLAGLFIARGSVNDPATTKYHLEFSLSSSDVALNALNFINSHQIEFNAKIAKRREKYIIYIKDAEKIVDILRLLGAQSNAFKFEDIRIERDFSNSINRLVNCEIANEKKALEAAREQLKYIHYLEYNYPLEKIDIKTLTIMKERLDHPDATSVELIEILKEKYGINISKSGISHRFNKIKEMALDHQKKSQ